MATVVPAYRRGELTCGVRGARRARVGRARRRAAARWRRAPTCAIPPTPRNRASRAAAASTVWACPPGR